MREVESSKRGLIDLVARLKGDGLTMVEIGSYAGESAEIFANTGRFTKIVCIDPWITDPNGDNHNSYTGMDAVEKRFDDVASRHPQIIKHKGTVDSFVLSELFHEIVGTVSFVYIDALHTYEGCKHDIEMVLEHLAPTQIISGHDYADTPDYIRGVKKAVNEKFGTPDETFCDTSWCHFMSR